MDEVSQIYSIAQRKLDFLSKLRRDHEDMLKNPMAANLIVKHIDSPRARSLAAADTHTCEWAIKTIENAIGRIKADHEALPGIIDDLKSSLHDVYLPCTYFIFATDDDF